MENNNQEQKAGKKSTQIQIVNNGVDIDKVEQMIKKEISIVLRDNSLIAENIARERLNEYTDIFLPKLVKANLIECFSDPAIQVFFRNTEKTAICTDSEKCYEILSELLIHRVNRKEDCVTVAATAKAIEIVDKISDDALLFLTVFLCVNNFMPYAGDIEQGLQILDDLYANILKDKEIPYSEKIIDNLEIAGAVRRQAFLSHNQFDEFYWNELEGYYCAGIDRNSDNYEKAKQLLESNGINEDIAFSDSLLENHVRIKVVNKEVMKKMIVSNQPDIVNRVLEEIYGLYDTTIENVNTAKNKFLDLVKKYPNIVKVRNWWNKNIIECGISITPIGRVLAHTNAKCIANNIPELD